MRHLCFSVLVLLGIFASSGPTSAWSEQGCVNACRATTKYPEYCINEAHRCYRFRNGTPAPSGRVKKFIDDYNERRRQGPK
jgi:hypothetical protein